MAQNITILGASYSNVPAVTLPKTGGGVARFTDVSDSTVTADKLAEGYIAYNANGVAIEGTASLTGGVTQDQNGYLVLDDQGEGGSITSGDIGALIDGSITTCIIPDGTTAIRSNAFSYCTSLESISIPDSVISIDANAFSYSGIVSVSAGGVINNLMASTFYNCQALTEVHFPNMIGTVNSSCFGNLTSAYACKNLAFADLGNASNIAANAFSNCSALNKVVLRKTDEVCALAGTTAFSNTPLRKSVGGTVYVPNSLITSYQQATNWSTMYNDGTLTFSAIEGSEYERN